MTVRRPLAATVTRRGFISGMGVFVMGCGRSSAPPAVGTASPPTPVTFNESHASSDATALAKADVRILFIGNSHTTYHNLPDLVCRMIRHALPGKTVAHHVVGVSHLDDASINPQLKAEIEFRPWTHIILQAQKISMSGKFLYSTVEGIDLAKRAKAKGAAVSFFAEWARKGEADERERTETIYTGMAQVSGASVIPVGRVWEVALAKRPDLPLYEPDGNHESEMGTFLTACVIASHLSGTSPVSFATVEFAELSATNRRFLAEIAGQKKSHP